ncbi:MAG UNVERIFIED_CONTAM: helix-turn-helix transcriptional regulator [Microcystis novacekii LVE1205-3]|jgi:transcriptional regulator with XRE-family HTH domain
MEKSKAVILRALGLMIREHRAALGISQEELGLRCHLDRTYISGLERGVRNPSLTALVTLVEGIKHNCIPITGKFRDRNRETLE